LRGVVLGVWGMGFWVLRLCGVGWGNGWVGLMGGVNKEEGGLLWGSESGGVGYKKLGRNKVSM